MPALTQTQIVTFTSSIKYCLAHHFVVEQIVKQIVEHLQKNPNSIPSSSLALVLHTFSNEMNENVFIQKLRKSRTTSLLTMTRM